MSSTKIGQKVFNFHGSSVKMFQINNHYIVTNSQQPIGTSSKGSSSGSKTDLLKTVSAVLQKAKEIESNPVQNLIISNLALLLLYTDTKSM